MRRCTTATISRAAAEVDLQAYLGPCRVIHAIGCGPLIRIEHLAHAANALPERVLVRCCERADEVWNPDFAAYAPETVDVAGRPAASS